MSELSFGNKKLGFGLMRLPLLDENDGASIDIELTKKMVDAFIKNGFTSSDLISIQHGCIVDLPVKMQQKRFWLKDILEIVIH